MARTRDRCISPGIVTEQPDPGCGSGQATGDGFRVAPRVASEGSPPRARRPNHRPIDSEPRRLDVSHAMMGKQKNGRLLNEYVNCALEFRMTVGYRSHSERSGRLASAMPATAIHHAR